MKIKWNNLAAIGMVLLALYLLQTIINIVISTLRNLPDFTRILQVSDDGAAIILFAFILITFVAVVRMLITNSTRR